MSEQIELLSVPLKDIDIGDRARKEYKNIGVLAEDIRKKGLIQPIAVQRQNDKFLLLAGGRRMAAAKIAGLEYIPCRIYSETLDELDRREIELMENVSRENLS